jgi:hypothetical protein
VTAGALLLYISFYQPFPCWLDPSYYPQVLLKGPAPLSIIILVRTYNYGHYQHRRRLHPEPPNRCASRRMGLYKHRHCHGGIESHSAAHGFFIFFSLVGYNRSIFEPFLLLLVLGQVLLSLADAEHHRCSVCLILGHAGTRSTYGSGGGRFSDTLSILVCPICSSGELIPRPTTNHPQAKY